LSTTAEVAQSQWFSTRRAPVLLALAALCAGALPATGQESAPTREPPHRAAATRREARIETDREAQRSFWQWMRDEARRVRRLDGGPAMFAMRFRISPQLAGTIQNAAQAQGLDPELGFRLVRAESNFNWRARSHAGALGLTQLMPNTARWLNRRMTTPERIMQPEANLAAGFGYLRRLIDKYGDLRLALLAYNRGEGAVDRDLRRGRNPENGYTRRVLGTGLDRYRGDGRRAP
jgi:soluble lytic murein transglycosylase-like protein